MKMSIRVTIFAQIDKQFNTHYENYLQVLQTDHPKWTV